MEQKVNKVVVKSTAGIFGLSIKGVITEAKIRDVDFLNACEGYKSIAESKINDFVNEYGLDLVIVSPSRFYGFLVFGAPLSTNLMIYPGKDVELRGGYIDDLISGYLWAMEKGEKGQVYLHGVANYDYK